MESRLEFLPLLFVLFLTFLVPPLVSRIRWLPVVVSEIIVGMIIGKSGFNLVKPDATLDFLGEIGLAILMFLAGLEIDFNLVLARPPDDHSGSSSSGRKSSSSRSSGATNIWFRAGTRGLKSATGSQSTEKLSWWMN